MNKDNYEDIINLPRYEPKNHVRMPLESRAAQFAPFAALTGYEDAVKETARLTDKRIEIDEELKIILNDKLQVLIGYVKNNPRVTVTYFVKDKNKEGGKYITIDGNIKKIDIDKNLIILLDKTIISIDDVINITGDIFKSMD